jgi:tetratricopeptide (TPR) repeat protein
MAVLEEAEDHFRKHDQPIMNSGNSEGSNNNPHPDLVKCLDNQGMMYRLQEDFHNALEKFEEALAVVGRSDIEKRQSLQMHIADMLSALDDVDGAIFYYQKILKEDKEERGSDDETELDAVIWHSIGLLHSHQVRYSRRFAYFIRFFCCVLCCVQLSCSLPNILSRGCTSLHVLRTFYGYRESSSWLNRS